mgnify:CR=1 FL=1
MPAVIPPEAVAGAWARHPNGVATAKKSRTGIFVDHARRAWISAGIAFRTSSAGKYATAA